MNSQDGLEETRNCVRLEKTFAFAVTKGSLIDFETTGIPKIQQEHEVITLGYLEGNRAAIIQRTTKEKLQFYSEIRNILEELPKPYLAYNAGFEREVMEVELGMTPSLQDFIDIMEPWKAKANSMHPFLKGPKLDELIGEPYDYFREPKISGGDIPAIWRDYLTTLDERRLRPIMNHCLSDVSRETILHVVYESQIGVNGIQVPLFGHPIEPVKPAVRSDLK